jgi:spore maturation protein CgeB
MLVHPGPQFSVHDVYQGWLEALHETGIRTHEYNLQDRLTFYEHAYLMTGDDDGEGHKQFRKALPRDLVVDFASNGILSTAYQFWPQVVIVVSSIFIPPYMIDVMRDRGTKVVMLFTESPYEEPRQLECAEHADLVLLNDPLKLDEYDKIGVPACYMPHAYRPSLHYPGPGASDMETDFAFVGTGFPTRVEFFERMAAAGAFEGIDVTLGGNWGFAPMGSSVQSLLSHDPNECVDNELTALIYKSAKAGINIYRHETDDVHHDGIACGPREIEMAACGLFYLRDSRPESDDLFPMLPTFESPEDAAEQLQWWLAHDTEREEAALKARAAVRPRTFAANVRKLLELLDEL